MHNWTVALLCLSYLAWETLRARERWVYCAPGWGVLLSSTCRLSVVVPSSVRRPAVRPPS